ncbi:hypothetical protein [Longispora albida]|uniref:hypothetical protein n=1 Tax=Longispora albida TaxID=203523 RepID=UPI000370295E|nr:hypothetical protein [Longispora albida]
MTTGTPSSASGGITRLNPADGLFLRAEHLTVMQDYARELALSAGLAAGTGVVHGYPLWMDDGELHAGPGLAISPAGRPLRSHQVVKIPLADLVPADDGFWVVEVVPASWLYGEENVYGNLCEDPCSPGAPIRPYSAEGVVIRLREDTMSGLSARETFRWRNWLASAYYERERERGAPWLIPAGPGLPVPPITGRDWQDPAGAPGGEGVPLGILARADGFWLLDVWTARRDIDGTSPRRVWQERLGMRPWDVFLAQVLQFQAHLSVAWAAVGTPVNVANADLNGALENLKAHLARQHVKPRWLEETISTMENAIPASAGQWPGLRDLGFGELPPAGYLPAPPASEAIASYVRALFGPGVETRICRTRADYVAGAIEEAQHLDRIPLSSDGQQPPRVDILVPALPADLPGTATPSYPWIAFTRRREAGCTVTPRKDLVDVYLVDDVERAARRLVELLRGKWFPGEEDKIGQVAYPPDEYAVPVPEDVFGTLQETLAKLKDRRWITVGVARAADRQPLMIARAGLLALLVRPDGTLDNGEIRAALDKGREPEAIVIFVGARRGTPIEPEEDRPPVFRRPPPG